MKSFALLTFLCGLTFARPFDSSLIMPRGARQPCCDRADPCPDSFEALVPDAYHPPHLEHRDAEVDLPTAMSTLSFADDSALESRALATADYLAIAQVREAATVARTGH